MDRVPSRWTADVRRTRPAVTHRLSRSNRAPLNGNAQDSAKGESVGALARI
jgi:hypothetical protein